VTGDLEFEARSHEDLTPMPQPTTPLTALLRVRGMIKERREEALAAATRALEQAGAALALVLERERAQEVLVAEAREGLRPAAVCSVAELHRREAFLAGQLSRLAARREERGAAAARRDEREREREAARAALVAAQGELEAVERSWEAWDRARRAEAERRAEQELEDLVASRGRPRSR